MNLRNRVFAAAVIAAAFCPQVNAACFDYQGSATGNPRWVIGPDNVSGTADDHSLQNDNALLRTIVPAHCSGPYGCDIIHYRVQYFSGGWGPNIIPGYNDDHVRGDGSVVKSWAMFNDHTFKMTYCN